MQQTLKLLSTLITDDIRHLTLEEISIQYKDSLDPSLLALAFHKTHRLTMTIANRYHGLSTDDIASHSLERLDMCLVTFNPEAAGFVTYYSTVFSNKLREETEALNTQKRKTIFYSESYEQLVETGFDVAVEEFDFLDEMMNLDNYNLTEREKEYCALVMNDTPSMKIAEILGVSQMTVSNMRKKLRIKLAPLALTF